MRPVPGTGSPQRTNLLAKLTIPLVTLLILGLLLDLLWRVPPLRPHSLYLPDPISHHVLAPNAAARETGHTGQAEEFSVVVRTNSLGFRGEEFSLQKAPNTYRIVLLGDSFVEAKQVPLEQTMAKRLQGMLDKRPSGHPYEVINAGVSGSSPALEYLFLREKVLALDPDLVVLFFAHNDVADDADYSQCADEDAQGLPTRVAPQKDCTHGLSPLRGAAKWVLYRSPFLLFVYQRTTSFRSSQNVPIAPFHGTEPVAQNDIAVLKQAYTPADEKAWARTLRYVSGIQDTVERAGKSFALVAAPAPPQVPNQMPNGKAYRWGLKPDETLSSTLMQDKLREFATTRGILSLDPLPAFRENADKRLFFDFDGHWTELGNDLAASQVYGFLASHFLNQ